MWGVNSEVRTEAFGGEITLDVKDCNNLNTRPSLVVILITLSRWRVRVHIIFDLSVFRTEYTSDPSSRTASRFSWLSRVTPSSVSPSNVIVCGTDNCRLDFLGHSALSCGASYGLGSSLTYSCVSMPSSWIVT